MTRCFNLLFVVVCIFTIVCLFISSLAAPVFAAEVSLGLGGGWQSSPYKGHDDEALPMPLLSVEWERFYFNLFEAGTHVWKDDRQALTLGLTYGGISFDSGETDNRALKKLDNRDATLNAFLQYSIEGDYGHASLKVLRDTLGNSDAFSAEASYEYPVSLGSLNISPGAGLQWDSKEQLDYYYGVSAREARKSGLDRYAPGGGFSPFLSLETSWRVADHWNLMISGKVLFLSEEIKDSPMVDAGQIFSAAAGLSYSF